MCTRMKVLRGEAGKGCVISLELELQAVGKCSTEGAGNWSSERMYVLFTSEPSSQALSNS